MYEAILFIYILSLLGYLMDFLRSNQQINKSAFWLLSTVWLLQTLLLFEQVVLTKSFPILTLNDGMFFYAWVLISFSLLMNYVFKVHFIVLFTNIFSFFILLLSILNVEDSVYNQGAEFVHELLIVHIVLTIISYGFLTISFLLSCMYLLQYRLIKEKKRVQWIWRFNDLKQLDLYSFRAVVLGFPLLLIGLILGFVWAYVSGAEFYWFDLKIIGSLIVLVFYTIYLYLRIARGYRGKFISVYNTAAFLLLLLNFLLFSLLSDFHFKGW